jgi:hypothetical protein
MSLPEIAEQIKASSKKIILIYGFNATGKTQLSVAYKNATKSAEGHHAGVYYNAYSEDLFVWYNDDENDGVDIQLLVYPSSLSRLHASLNEGNVRKKLKAYKPKYDFIFNLHRDIEQGIKSISFFIPDSNPDAKLPFIKISRGEERVFVWCFFLALFEVEGWADEHNAHIFIDDPVSSLDDHNIFVTSSTLYDLIETHSKNRKIIITTHHFGLFAILADMMTKGEKSDSFKKATKLFMLSGKSGNLTLETTKNDVLLYHLRLLQLLEKAQQENAIRAYHFALLRQVLENISSFLGTSRVSYVLEQIGITDPEEVIAKVNTLSHKKVYYYESDELVPDNLETFEKIFNGLKERYKFVLYAPAPPPEEGAAPAPANTK